MNPEFVSSNDLVVVSAKRYEQVLLNLRNQRYSALDLAIEVVYHPTFDEKPHEGVMQRRVDSASQNYQKLVGVMDFTYHNGTMF